MSKKPSTPKRRRWLRRAAALSALAVVGTGALWVGVHRIPWLGPMVADGLRATIGVQNVTRLEDFAYGVQDKVNHATRKSEAPKAYWKVPEKKAAAPLPSAEVGACTVAPFAPQDVGPVHTTWSAPGDGQWIAIEDKRHTKDTPRLYKTLLHPDKRRSWAAVSVVALDLRQVDLHMMAGSREPISSTREALGMKRPAMVPAEHQPELLAAFNGGFKAQHGHYGMKVDGITLLPPRIRACWVVMHKSGKLEIGNHERMKDHEADYVWWRQTPNCMIDQGELHPGLRSERNTAWGATLSGDTVIRRSALGLSKDGMTLYAGIGDHTTAPAMARAMQHAGAHAVAQLDVNWSYPKFVVYEPKSKTDKTLVATKLSDGFQFAEGEYIRLKAPRDFFYVTRKGETDIERAVCGEGKSARNDVPARDGGG